MINDVIITPLDTITTPNGDVLHAMKNDSVSLSPIQIDMTNHSIVNDLRDWLT